MDQTYSAAAYIHVVVMSDKCYLCRRDIADERSSSPRKREAVWRKRKERVLESVCTKDHLDGFVETANRDALCYGCTLRLG